MSLKDQINQLFKEIKVYSSQALYDLAKQKCVELTDLVKGSDQFRHKDTLLDVISRKISSIEEDARNSEGINKTTKMTSKELDVVKRLVFASGEADKDAAAWEVAKAFLILEQYDKALQEFNQLFDNRYKLASAAKNILRCHIGMAAIDDAIKAYQGWSSSEIFSSEQLESLKTFLQNILDKKNIKKEISKLTTDNVDNSTIDQEDEFLEIISVKLCMNGRSNEKLEATLDVVGQNGATINVIVPKKNIALVENLNVGKEIENAEFNSSSIVFTDLCRVSEKTRIESGPNQGDYSVYMTIVEPDSCIN